MHSRTELRSILEEPAPDASMNQNKTEGHETEGTQSEVVDEKVRGLGERRSERGSNTTRVVDEILHLLRDRASENGTQEHVEHVPVEE